MPNTTLVESQVKEIKTRYAAGGIKQTDLAKEYGVGKQVINRIVRNKMWKHV